MTFEDKSVSKTVLVTGGTGAIGSEIVRLLTQKHPEFQIVANYHRDQKRALQLQQETSCALHRADISCENAVGELFQDHSFYAVVHAAGVTRDALMMRQTRAGWDESLAVNLESAFLVARAALQTLEEGGRLVFLTSRVGESGNRGQSAYAAAKAGVLALAKTAAREGAKRRLGVNAVCPGFVPSAMNEELSAQTLAAAREASLFQEFGTAQETANLVQWLLCPENGSVSGQVFHADNRL